MPDEMLPNAPRSKSFQRGLELSEEQKHCGCDQNGFARFKRHLFEQQLSLSTLDAALPTSNGMSHDPAEPTYLMQFLLFK